MQSLVFTIMFSQFFLAGLKIKSLVFRESVKFSVGDNGCYCETHGYNGSITWYKYVGLSIAFECSKY